MKLRLRLSVRMLFLIIGSAIVVFFGTIRIISSNLKKTELIETMKIVDSQTDKYAHSIKVELENSLNLLRNYVYIVEQNYSYKHVNRRDFFNELLKNIVDNNKIYTAVWNSWELRFVDKSYTKNYGRLIESYYNTDDGRVKFIRDSLDLEGDDLGSTYSIYKKSPEEEITDPYWFSYTNSKADEILETSLLVPIFMNNEFAGIAGADLKMEYFQNIFDSINVELDYDVMLFSFNGDIIAYPDRKEIGNNIVVIDTFLSNHYNIIDKIQSGENSSFILQGKSGADSVYFSLSSFQIGNIYTPWCVLVSAPLSVIQEKIDNTFNFGIKAALFGIILLTIVILLFTIRIVNPLQKVRKALSILAKGNVSSANKINVKAKDERGEMALALNNVIEGLSKATNFAKDIGKGNYDSELKKLGDKDNLGTAILEMRDNLVEAGKDEQKIKEQESQQEWMSQGINIFNKILSSDNQNLTELASEIIRTLTFYLDASMGGVFFKSDTKELEFNLIAFLGFDKAKYEKSTIAAGEGIVGQCVLEKQTVFINDVPSNCYKIKSGLGKSIPKSILAVPLISNQVLIGVLEIESLKEILPHQINFVEKISESIASTLDSVKINERTSKLLDKSEKQAKELEQQEESMRYNLEAIKIKQEEALKKEGDQKSIIEMFNELIPVIEYDKNGKVIYANEFYSNIYNIRNSQLIGKYHKSDAFLSESEIEKHKQFWFDLNQGQTKEIVENIKKGKKERLIREKFIPIRGESGEIKKIVCIGFDITGSQIKDNNVSKQIISKTSLKNIKTPNDAELVLKPEALNKKTLLTDFSYIKKVYKNNTEKIYEVLKQNYETLPKQIQKAEEYEKSKNYNSLKNIVGLLKPKMSYLGLKGIYSKLNDIEKIIYEQKDLENINIILSSIVEIWKKAELELKNFLKL